MTVYALNVDHNNDDATSAGSVGASPSASPSAAPAEKGSEDQAGGKVDEKVGQKTGDKTGDKVDEKDQSAAARRGRRLLTPPAAGRPLSVSARRPF